MREYVWMESGPGVLFFSPVRSCTAHASLYRQPAGTTLRRCSHQLIYRVNLVSFQKQRDLLHSAADVSPFFSSVSSVPMEWASGLLLHMLPERVIHKGDLLYGEATRPAGEGDEASCQSGEEWDIFKMASVQ